LKKLKKLKFLKYLNKQKNKKINFKNENKIKTHDRIEAFLLQYLPVPAEIVFELGVVHE